jgi:hypothetical protein
MPAIGASSGEVLGESVLPAAHSLDQAAAARTFGHRSQTGGEHRVRRRCPGLPLWSAVGQAPAVVDGAHTLLVHLRIQLRVDRIVGLDGGDGLFVQIQGTADIHHDR